MKVQTFNNRATVVTIAGYMSIPNELWSVFPDKIFDWIFNHQGIDVSYDPCTKDKKIIRLELSGKAVCSEEDAFNAETGKRIAESRAKLKLYKFVHNILCQLYEYYYGLILGNKFSSKCISKEIDSNEDTIFDSMSKYQGLWIKESHHLGKLLEEA